MSGLTRSVVLPIPLQSVTQMRSNVQMVIAFQPVIYVMVRKIVLCSGWDEESCFTAEGNRQRI